MVKGVVGSVLQKRAPAVALARFDAMSSVNSPAYDASSKDAIVSRQRNSARRYFLPRLGNVFLLTVVAYPSRTSTSDPRVVHQQQNNDIFLASHFGFSPATLALTSMPHDTIGDASLDTAYTDLGGLNCWLTGPEREREGSDTITEALAMGESPFIDPTFTQEFTPLAQSDGPDLYKLSHLAEDDVAYLKSKNVFSLPPKEVQDELVNNYFLYVHPLLPIMREKDFRDDYETNLTGTSLLLYRAMVFVATSV